MHARTFITAAAIAAAAVPAADAAVVAFEAESGTFSGTQGFNTVSDPDAFGDQAITNSVNSSSNMDSIAAYTVNFSEAGTYDLFARYKVADDGQAAPSNDSFFVSFSFPSNTASDVVNGLPGQQGEYVVTNLSATSANGGPFDPAPTYTITSSNQTATFRVAGREDGLVLDAFAFVSGDDVATFDEAAFAAAIPEPASAAVAAAGLGLLTLRRRR